MANLFRQLLHGRTVGEVFTMFFSGFVSLHPVTQVATTERTLDTVSLSSIEHSRLGKVTWINYTRCCFRPVVKRRQANCFVFQTLKVWITAVNGHDQRWWRRRNLRRSNTSTTNSCCRHGVVSRLQMFLYERTVWWSLTVHLVGTISSLPAVNHQMTFRTDRWLSVATVPEAWPSQF